MIINIRTLHQQMIDQLNKLANSKDNEEYELDMPVDIMAKMTLQYISILYHKNKKAQQYVSKHIKDKELLRILNIDDLNNI